MLSHRGASASAAAAAACLVLLLGASVHAQQQQGQPLAIPLTYRSQRPLADDAAPLRRHKAQAIGVDGAVGVGGGHFLGIDRMHLPEGQFAVRGGVVVYVCIGGWLIYSGVWICGWHSA